MNKQPQLWIFAKNLSFARSVCMVQIFRSRTSKYEYQIYGAIRLTHHDVVRVEDGHVLEDLPGHPDELGYDQTADRKHGDAPVLWEYNGSPGRSGAGRGGGGGEGGVKNGLRIVFGDPRKRAKQG